MKKSIFAFLCFIFIFSFVACKGTSSTVTSPQTTHNFSVNKNEVTLEVNDTFDLVAIYGEETVTYSVDDATVATVSASGVVTALKEGVANITISAGGQERICKVNVVTYEYSIALVDAGNKNMTTGTVLSFSAKTYRDGEEYEGTISWSSTGGTVTATGKKATFTATQVGEYTLTATSEKGATVSCTITVGEALSDFQS